MIFGDERRGANSSCILALIQLKMDSAVWSTRSTMGFCRPESHLLHSRRTRSAIPREPLARSGRGGLLRTATGPAATTPNNSKTPTQQPAHFRTICA